MSIDFNDMHLLGLKCRHATLGEDIACTESQRHERIELIHVIPNWSVMPGEERLKQR